ncbi:MAG: N-6 DNA methylase [Salibacteraceae bacterium]
MAYLTSSQRSDLEQSVLKARRIAEKGAANALKTLAVHEHEPYAHMSSEQRTFRNTLRYKGRLLGDTLKDNGKQTIDKLAYELAYDYWHKMLFAAFLEANHLLMHPSGVAVSFEEVEELAPEEGFADKWVAAAHYASAMLPAIFRVNDPLMKVDFALNDRIALEEVLDTIEPAIYKADDALGWVYQYWQSDAKADINASGDKIDGEKLPAVTQLFTEPYMVHFLIDNTIGAWWMSRNPGKTPPVAFEYLRILDDGKPAAGSFDGWPDTVKELTCMDPCMGSGHFVTSLYHVLAPLRMKEEGLNKEEATVRVIQENLHGLELDARCTQIAAFNLALTAWKFCSKHFELPDMNLACSGIAPKGKVKDWVDLVDSENEYDRNRLQNGMRALYTLFQKAPELGSLIDPATFDIKAESDGFSVIARMDELLPVLLKALEKEENIELAERGVVAAGIAKTSHLLSQKYILQITNVPYLGKGKFDEVLSDYVLKYYADAKGDLATIFMERLLKTTRQGGTLCSVLPHNWLFLTTYKKYRKRLLNVSSFDFVIRLGEHAFDNKEAAGAFACIFSLTNESPTTNHCFFGINAYNNRGEEPIYATEKAKLLKTAELKIVNQKKQLENPDARILLEEAANLKLLSNFTDSLVGLQTSDDSMFVIDFWEQTEYSSKKTWEYLQITPNNRKYFQGFNQLVRWELGKGLLLSLSTAYPTKGLKALGKKGIAINRMGEIFPYLFSKERFHQNVAVLLPDNENHLPAIWCFCSSPQFNEEVRKIDQALKVTNASLTKIPFDLEYWQKVAEEKYPNGLPEPYSNDATQWLFHGHPLIAEQPLQTAIARFLGYQWPAETDEEMELAKEARDLITELEQFNELRDEDGIVCIPSVATHPPAATRLQEYLRAVWADNWQSPILKELLLQEEAKAANLEKWLQDEFFIGHCKVFNNRPFIWHIWDGRKDGFGALVNYHKLTKENLQKLIYSYLDDWIRQCERKVKNGESGADGQLSAAKALKVKLLLILEGEPPYDIFVRWKSLEEQPIGWEPDLNDGVRINIYPFMQAGVLRKDPNLKWKKDRGKNPEGSHWGPERHNRYEDLDDKYKLKDENKKIIPHLTNEIKRAARRK